MFVLSPPPLTNRYNFQLSFACTHIRVHWGHARRHGKWLLEMLTVESADYMQEMDCHYFDSWSVHKRSVCKSWLVLMCQLNIVVFWKICNICRVFLPVLLVEHEPEVAGQTAPATVSGRHWQHFPCSVKKCFYCILTIAQLLIVENVAPTVHFTDLVSNRSHPPNL